MHAGGEVSAVPILCYRSAYPVKLQHGRLRLQRECSRHAADAHSANQGPVVHRKERIVHSGPCRYCRCKRGSRPGIQPVAAPAAEGNGAGEKNRHPPGAAQRPHIVDSQQRVRECRAPRRKGCRQAVMHPGFSEHGHPARAEPPCDSQTRDSGPGHHSRDWHLREGDGLVETNHTCGRHRPQQPRQRVRRRRRWRRVHRLRAGRRSQARQTDNRKRHAPRIRTPWCQPLGARQY